MRKMIIAENGKTVYSLAVPPDATESERFAAGEFRRYFEKCTGAELPVNTDGRGYRVSVAFEEGLGGEEIRIRTENGCLLLSGGRPRGVLYAVYQFLEDWMGVRWYSPELEVVPEKRLLEIPEIDFRYKPPFVYRNCFVWGAMHDPLWAARNRLNGLSFGVQPMDEKLGGASNHSPAGHSFSYLVPPAEYFESHPEYYALVNGGRTQSGQLCLSNPDVFDICLKKLRAQLASTDAAGVSFAQNDCLGACECPECRSIDEKCGAQSGSIISFCNRLAEALCGEFPDKMIKTYAYQYGQTAPKGIRVHKNVQVWICSIEACYSHPHGSCGCIRRELPTPDGRNPFFPRDIKDWGKICDNLFVWNYDTNFRNFIHPHPNLHVLGPNIRFFRDCGVKGVFEQNCTTSPNTEMQALRAYIIAKCLWNPDTDDKMIMDEFIGAWFGSAAAPIAKYIELLRREVTENDRHLLMSTCPATPNNREEAITSSLTRSAAKAIKDSGRPLPEHGLALYMTDDVSAEANRLFDLAERMAENEIVLRRVRIERMALRYSDFCRMKLDDPSRTELVESFFDDCTRFGILETKEACRIEKSRAAALEDKYIF